jgi:hypothetical protein
MEAAAGLRRTHCKTKSKSPVGKAILATMEKGICTPNWKNKQTVHALRQRQKPDVPVHSATTIVSALFLRAPEAILHLSKKPAKNPDRAPFIVAAGTPPSLANILLHRQRIA